MAEAGCSGTPLAKKLGLKDGMEAVFLDMPESVRAVLDGIATTNTGSAPDFVHMFQTERTLLDDRLKHFRNHIASDGMIWVSWPKKTSKVRTEITEDVVRELCLPLGLVDVKVCAVDQTWSGLKLVIRRELRS